MYRFKANFQKEDFFHIQSSWSIILELNNSLMRFLKKKKKRYYFKVMLIIIIIIIIIVRTQDYSSLTGPTVLGYNLLILWVLGFLL